MVTLEVDSVLPANPAAPSDAISSLHTDVTLATGLAVVCSFGCRGAGRGLRRRSSSRISSAPRQVTNRMVAAVLGCPPTGPGLAADRWTGQGLAWRRIGELPLLAFAPPLNGDVAGRLVEPPFFRIAWPVTNSDGRWPATGRHRRHRTRPIGLKVWPKGRLEGSGAIGSLDGRLRRLLGAGLDSF